MRVPRRNFSMHEYLVRHCEGTKPRFSFGAETKEDWVRWREQLRASLLGRLAPWPESCDLNATEEEPIDDGAYLRQRVVFDSERGMSVPAWLLLPKHPIADPCPAVLAVHGHGYGKDELIGLTHGEGARTASVDRQDYRYGRGLAERGYVVLAPDFRAWGERQLGFGATGAERCDFVFLKAALLGLTLLTLQIHDARRCLDYLCTRPEVSADRLGCVGLSFGGNLTMWLAALDERVKAAVMGCFLSTYRAHGIDDWICGNEVVPGLLLDADMPDVAGLIAPRPLLIENGENDGCGLPDRHRPRRLRPGAARLRRRWRG